MQYKYNIMPKCHPLHPWDAVATISLAFQMARIVRQRSPGIYEWHCTHTPTHTHRGIHIYIMQFDMIMDGFVLKSLSSSTFALYSFDGTYVLWLQQRVRSTLRWSLPALLHRRGQLQQTGAFGAPEGQIQAHTVPQDCSEE